MARINSPLTSNFPKPRPLLTGIRVSGGIYVQVSQIPEVGIGSSCRPEFSIVRTRTEENCGNPHSNSCELCLPPSKRQDRRDGVPSLSI
ncbi:hypothetical protein LINPERPRIM_LOCUS16375 [Linum perenne]